MASDDDALGLNLVFSPPAGAPGIVAGGGATGGGGGAGGGVKKAKRKTKFDRRRERGRLLKLAKEEEKRRQGGQQGGRQQGHQQGHQQGEPSRALAKTDEGGGTTLAGVAAAPGGGRVARAAPPSAGAESATKQREAGATDATAEKEAEASPPAPATSKEADGGEEAPAPPPSSDADEAGDGSGGKRAAEDVAGRTAPGPASARKSPAAAASTPAEEGAMAPSRRKRPPTSLSEEQRARYLATFHARPRELDRGEGAARDIKPSMACDVIFGGRDDEDGGFDDVDWGKEEDANDCEGVAGSEDESRGREGKAGGGPDGNDATAAAEDAEAVEPTCPFARLGLHPHLASTLTSPDKPFQLRRPTVVQSRSIAVLLPTKQTKRKAKQQQKLESNLFIQSETGSGKTLAYLLPILQHLAVDPATQTLKRIDRRLGGTRTIILCPTRELATQTYATAADLCRSFPWIVPGCLSGGEKRKSEKARLRKGIAILVATPGRLLDHLAKTESLLVALKNKLEWLVLDEADRLLDAGLGGQVEQIVQHLRANQPGSGPKRDGVTWRSVLVSATVTTEIEGLARTVLGGEGWTWARGHGDEEAAPRSNGVPEGAESEPSSRTEDRELDRAAPRQLAQLYMVVSAKLRLASLVAFLAARAAKGERTVVFLSTCDGVDYHHALFTSMESVLDDKDDDDDETAGDGGIFGKGCPIYKLHGDIPHPRRLSTLKAFSSDRSSILLATDVAARGLNFPSLDWIVQYDVPCETKDYVHRAGRSARAGRAGHALLFLLPSERQYVEVLRLRGLTEVSPLSLSATLAGAAALCPGVAREGAAKAGGNAFSDSGGEAFTSAIQERLEQCVIQNDVEYKASIEKKFKGDPKRRRKLKKAAAGPLLEGARKAFSAFVRAYPAKEKAVRHIFNARALHLGHVARSLALREAPKMVSKGSGGSAKNVDVGKEKAREGGRGEKRKSRLAFGDRAVERDGGEATAIKDDEADRNLSLLQAMGGEGTSEDRGRRTAGSKKPKSSSGGARDNQKRMMEKAMMLQSQEFM